MRVFDVDLNGRRLCRAGVGEFGVLAAMLNVGAPRSRFSLFGGPPIDDGTAGQTWARFEDLVAGDELRIRIAERGDADPSAGWTSVPGREAPSVGSAPESPPAVGLEVTWNGRRVCLAADGRHSSVSMHLVWCRFSHEGLPETHLSVNGLRMPPGLPPEHLTWFCLWEVGVGDEIIARIRAVERGDPPFQVEPLSPEERAHLESPPGMNDAP